MGLTIPYEYMGIDHGYEPEDDQTKAKHTAANRWVQAVNNWGELGKWAFHPKNGS